ncbi:MAG: deAMPylase SidD family protein [Legionella sp.]|nr:deAMPylase SidD family protein [Legionella sp.]
MMHSIIVQSCNGVAGGVTYASTPNALDNGNSKIHASSLYVNLNEQAQNIAEPKNTDDKIVIGYTKEGMAFQIVVDGFFGGERKAIFSFIDDYVVPLMGQYSIDLSESLGAQNVTDLLIRTLYSLRSTYAMAAEFTMSLSMTYKVDEDLFCAGFGIGDTGLVIKRGDGTIEQLVFRTEVDGTKDAFDMYSTPHIDSVIQRNTVFNTKVMPGDELVGYTYIQPELELMAKEFKAPGTQKLVKQFNLDSRHFNNQTSLYSQLLAVVVNQQVELVNNAKAAAKVQRFGDDFTVGSLIIPDAILMNQLRINALVVAVASGLNFYIASLNEKKGLLSFFTGLSKNKAQVELYKELLSKHHTDDLSLLTIFLAMTTSNNDKQLHSHLIKYLGFQSVSLLQTIIQECISDKLKCVSLQESTDSGKKLADINESSTKVIAYINNPKSIEIDLILNQFNGKNKIIQNAYGM